MYFISIYNYSTKQTATCHFESIIERDDFADNIYDAEHLEIVVGCDNLGGMEYEDYLCLKYNGRGYF